MRNLSRYLEAACAIARILKYGILPYRRLIRFIEFRLYAVSP